jgi:hypothetical protein
MDRRTALRHEQSLDHCRKVAAKRREVDGVAGGRAFAPGGYVGLGDGLVELDPDWMVNPYLRGFDLHPVAEEVAASGVGTGLNQDSMEIMVQDSSSALLPEKFEFLPPFRPDEDDQVIVEVEDAERGDGCQFASDGDAGEAVRDETIGDFRESLLIIVISCAHNSLFTGMGCQRGRSQTQVADGMWFPYADRLVSAGCLVKLQCAYEVNPRSLRWMSVRAFHD